MSEIKRISSELSRTQAISQLSENDQILKGRIETQKFDKHELDQIYQDLGLLKKYTREYGLGNTVDTYKKWQEFKQEAGYSIWKIPLANYRHNTKNQLFLDEKILDYRGQAASEFLLTFDKALVVYMGMTTDQTLEAGTEGGTAFTFLQLSDATTTFLYIDANTTFTAVDFDLETIGSGYNIQFQYWDGETWINWDGTCEISG